MKIKQHFKNEGSSSETYKKIKSDIKFPYSICLELCDLNVKNNYYDFVLKTLKSFSVKQEYESRNPHPIHKSKNLENVFKKAEIVKANQVLSLDIKSRNDSKRMLYCFDKENRTYKILSLCTDETH